VAQLEADPTATLQVEGNHNSSEDAIVATSRANNVVKYLTDHGIARSRLSVEIGTKNTRTVELWLTH
jgi:hypothetical protein